MLNMPVLQGTRHLLRPSLNLATISVKESSYMSTALYQSSMGKL